MLIGKTLRRLARLRGGGSALPGLFVEKIEPGFLADALNQLPHGVVLVTGTNGKTTTTKLIAETLEAQGLRVFTNRTGSNFTRGVVAALIHEMDLSGILHYDIAILELDEAHAIHFVNQVKPTVSVLLNVMRDQLDRFGEIDYTTKLLTTIAENTTGTVVINKSNPFTLSIAEHINGHIGLATFDASAALQPLFVSDLPAKPASNPKPLRHVRAEVVLETYEGQKATYTVDGKPVKATLSVTGHHNFLNAAAALATCLIVAPKVSARKLLNSMSEVMPAFGRGEVTTYNDIPLEFILVKNPAGFKSALVASGREKHTHQTRIMIAVNDNYADGRDMSWLWDVDFSPIKDQSIAMVTGSRAYDMALRLQYDNIRIGTVEVQLKKALSTFLKTNTEQQPMRIYCTYTAMLALRHHAMSMTSLEKAL